jgi:hypothetical protein
MVEDGNPNIKYMVTAHTYGGRSLADHWQLGSQNFIKQSTLTIEEQEAHIKSLEDMSPTDPLYENYRNNALNRHRTLLSQIGSGTLVKYDIVVLQSWNDDRVGDASEYMVYAPKFAEIIKALGGHVVLYETTPNTQNALPLTSPPTNRTSVVDKTKSIIRLANKLDATVVPMALAAWHCQMDRPDFTLRYVGDLHPSQTMGYLTISVFYGALMGKSPEGLPLDRVTDPLADPKLKIFSEADKTELQQIAWKALNEFNVFVSSREEISKVSPFKIYPNPSSGMVRLKLSENDISPLCLSLFSSDGKTVYSEIIEHRLLGEEILLDLSHLPSSLYFLKLETSSGAKIAKISLR